MEIQIVEVRSVPTFRRIRAGVVCLVARMLRVPIAVRDEFRGASPGTASSSCA